MEGSRVRIIYEHLKYLMKEPGRDYMNTSLYLVKGKGKNWERAKAIEILLAKKDP